jgi:hypothetical protein
VVVVVVVAVQVMRLPAESRILQLTAVLLPPTIQAAVAVVVLEQPPEMLNSAVVVVVESRRGLQEPLQVVQCLAVAAAVPVVVSVVRW